MMRLCAACRNTSVRRTTGTAPDEMTSASTWPGPTEGSWSMSPTTKSAALSGTAFVSDCISMTSTMEVSSTTNRSQSSGLSSPRLKPPPLASTSSKRKTNLLLGPRQGLVGVDPRPRQGAICQSHQPFGDSALCAMQARQKYTGRFANPVGNYRAFLQLEIERGTDELLRHLEQLLGERYQLFRRQAAMSLIHGLGQRVRNPRADPHHGG